MPIMTYGCQTWSLTKELSSKLQTTQRSMKRKMLNIRLQDKLPCTTIRQKTGVTDVLKHTLTQKNGIGQDTSPDIQTTDRQKMYRLATKKWV